MWAEMNRPSFTNAEYYHIYNRGVEKRDVFMNKADQLRFLETLNYYRFAPQPMKLSDHKKRQNEIKKIDKQVELVKIYCYCLMPNHFHLLIRQVHEGGITRFMKFILNSYTKYFNIKYDRVGSLFQGVFKAKLVENDEYLLQLSRYIHRNPFPPSRWESKLAPLSSYYYYLSGEQHLFCEIECISNYFSKSNPSLSYQSFVENTDLADDPLLFTLLIDDGD